MKFIGWFILIFVIAAFLSLFTGMCSDTVQTVQKEYAPSAMLRKYEWFKDASAQLDARMSNIGAYESRFVDIRKNYGVDSLNRKVWMREDREQYSVWQSEYAGLKASYNDLAAQYNAAMVKFNYAFCNKGSLPQGATVPLPREYKPYIDQ